MNISNVELFAKSLNAIMTSLLINKTIIISFYLISHWQIQGGGVPGNMRLSPIIFVFKQFLGKSDLNNRLAPSHLGVGAPVWEILDLPLLLTDIYQNFIICLHHITGREQLIRSHSSARFCF